MSRLTDLSKSLLETPLIQTPSLAALRQRANLRRQARRRKGMIVIASSVLGVGLVGTTIGVVVTNTPRTPVLSSQVTAFDALGPVKLLNREVTLSPKLDGWKLVSDRQTNVTTLPVNYSRSITYSHTSRNGEAFLTVTINQGEANPDFTTPPAAGIANAATQTVEVDGHRALLLALSNQSISKVPTIGKNGVRSITIIGRCGNNITSNPNATPFSPSNCQNANQAYSAEPQTVLQWKLTPLLGVQLVGLNLGPQSLENIASAIVIHPSLDNCMPGGNPIRSGQCAPGTIASPPVTTPQVPIGGIELAYGTASHKPWVLSASQSPSNPWMELVYANAVVTLGSSSSPATMANWDNASNGQTFFSGRVPSWVTSVRVSGPSNQTTALLPTALKGWRYFILPMGVTKASCNGACAEPISATFYEGTTVVGHIRLATTETTFGGFKLRQPNGPS